MLQPRRRRCRIRRPLQQASARLHQPACSALAAGDDDISYGTECPAQKNRGIHRATGWGRILSLSQCQGSESRSDHTFKRPAELLCAELPALVPYARPACVACVGQGPPTVGVEGATRVLDRRRFCALSAGPNTTFQLLTLLCAHL